MLIAAAIALAWYLEWRGCVPPKPTEYDRADWKHWIDEDDDCQDTRQEVLIAEASGRVRFANGEHCKVASGTWRCPYTGKTISDPKLLDVDHLVPLAEAHRSGGDTWTAARREAYANALGDDAHLVAVDRGANRAKRDKDPAQWMPSAPGYRCEYVRAWDRIKRRWDLRMDDAEARYVEQALAACARGEIPELPTDERGSGNHSGRA